MSKATITEVIQSLTGHEDEAIFQRFHHDISTIFEARPTMSMRAIAFVLKLREPEVKEAAAYKYAMDLPFDQLNELFADEADELMPEEPITDQGKEPGPLNSEPDASPSSAS